jgi:hypothetical protein
MRTPDIEGRAARAWKVVMPSDGPPEWSGTIAAYLVHMPGAHAFWSWWLVSVVHLRPIEGVKPANKSYEEAEYEFLTAPIHPDHPPDPDDPGAGFETIAVDVAVQFNGTDDEQAAELCMMSVTLMTRGRASPDSDYRRWWTSAIRNGAKHAALGGHPKETV